MIRRFTTGRRTRFPSPAAASVNLTPLTGRVESSMMERVVVDYR